jgi:hypothetical protein
MLRACGVNQPGSLVQTCQHVRAGSVKCWRAPASGRLRGSNIKQSSAEVDVLPLQPSDLTRPQPAVGCECCRGVGILPVCLEFLGLSVLPAAEYLFSTALQFQRVAVTHRGLGPGRPGAYRLRSVYILRGVRVWF